MSDQVLVALITGAFGVVVALLEWMRRQNNRDHSVNAHKLDMLHDIAKSIGQKIDTHINDHAKGEFNE